MFSSLFVLICLQGDKNLQSLQFVVYRSKIEITQMNHYDKLTNFEYFKGLDKFFVLLFFLFFYTRNDTETFRH